MKESAKKFLTKYNYNESDIEIDFFQLGDLLDEFTKELQEENKRLKEENFQLRLKGDDYDNDNPVTCTICGEHFKSFEDAEGHRCSIARNSVVPKLSY